jgi:hypothetical protein
VHCDVHLEVARLQSKALVRQPEWKDTYRRAAGKSQRCIDRCKRD